MANRSEDVPATATAENSGRTAPRGRPFPRGKSGNPGGRPRLEGEIRRLAQQHAGAAFLNMVRLMRSSNPRVALAASAAVLERAIGKPPARRPLETRLSVEDYRAFKDELSAVQADIEAAARLNKMFQWP